MGAGGSTELYTELMIHDCLWNNDIFGWVRHPDGSIRPKNNDQVCIEQEFDPVGNGVRLILDNCYDGYKEWNFAEISSPEPTSDPNCGIQPESCLENHVGIVTKMIETFGEENCGYFSYINYDENPCDYGSFVSSCDWSFIGLADETESLPSYASEKVFSLDCIDNAGIESFYYFRSCDSSSDYAPMTFELGHRDGQLRSYDLTSKCYDGARWYNDFAKEISDGGFGNHFEWIADLGPGW